MENKQELQSTKTWPELGIGLYDKLTERNAEISYNFDNMEVSIPSHVGPNAKHADWKINGTLKITTHDSKQ